MVKVLVANENTEQTTNFCKYLQNDNALFTSSANSGIEALNKYNEINPHIFILDSHFKDMETTEIIDRLSSTVVEKRNSNIILTMDELKEQNNFLDVAKIYKFVEIPKLTQQLLYDTVKQMDNENKYDDFTDKQLNSLLATMNMIVTSPRTKLLIEAVKECYYNTNLACNLGEVMKILSYKHNGYSVEAIQSAFRGALAPLNYNRENLQEHPLVKMFDPSKNISPKVFLETITEYLYIKNNQDIDF